MEFTYPTVEGYGCDKVWSLCIENSTGIYSGNTCHDLTLSSMEFTYPRVEGYGCDKVCVLKTAQAFILVTHATILLSHPWNLLTLG